MPTGKRPVGKTLMNLYLVKQLLDRNPQVKARLKNAGLKMIGRGRRPNRSTPNPPVGNPPRRPA
ncbi:MAG: hypothetical protein WBV82_32440 [Myxococcaceae bacterium]